MGLMHARMQMDSASDRVSRPGCLSIHHIPAFQKYNWVEKNLQGIKDSIGYQADLKCALRRCQVVLDLRVRIRLKNAAKIIRHTSSLLEHF